jgi:glycosyltransferase involved in cell wall biosynthesis
MHVLFIHPNFPSQFYPIAARLAATPGCQATLLTSVDTSNLALPFQHATYRLKPGPAPKAFYNPGDLNVLFDHAYAVYRGLREAKHLQPDVIVGHVSYGTWLYLRNLYPGPFVGYFEILPPRFWGPELVLRPEFPPTEEIRLFNATYHTLTYLHLHAMDAGYTPTQFQLSTAPPELRPKIRVIFDGIDTDLFRPMTIARPTEFRGIRIRPETKVVTYVSRGLESVRGFDIFMKVAKKLEREFSDIVFLIAGQDRTNYGHELHHIGPTSFKEWVLSQDQYDPEKYRFLGLVPTAELPTLFNLSDVHFYLTVPFVLSWSLINAMSCGCAIVASNTEPVREVIDHGVHGLLADFYDIDGLTKLALQILRAPEAHHPLREQARQRVLERYDGRICHQQLIDFFRSLTQK